MADLISELLIVLISPAISTNFVTLTPISNTSPLKSSIWIISPIWNCFSKIINRPLKTSAIKLWAPNEIASPIIPALASSVGVSTPQAERIKNSPTIAIPYFKTDIIS